MGWNDNPLFERIVARMQADDAVAKLNGHWAARLERWVCHAPAVLCEKVGFPALSDAWSRLTAPLSGWLAERQSAWLRDRYF